MVNIYLLPSNNDPDRARHLIAPSIRIIPSIPLQGRDIVVIQIPEIISALPVPRVSLPIPVDVACNDHLSLAEQEAFVAVDVVRVLLYLCNKL